MLDYATTLANERRLALKREERAGIKSEINTASLLAQRAAKIIEQSQQALQNTEAEIEQLLAGAGPGVTDDFGQYSTLEQAMQAERYAGKSASIDFVKANPECTEDEAKAAYIQAALTARPADRQWLIINPDTLRQEYSANLVRYNLIPDTTWESWREWILVTDKDVIMGVN